ncbi:MAG: hypothetical protein IJ566_01775 [Cardiobacteriaceae bacterium]|nr:hypothetical protein [Cardiobacteriaceae bacterium]
MKKISILLSVFFTTLFAFSAHAGDNLGDHPSEIAVKIIDQDKNGTNFRAAPAGEVKKVIAFSDENSRKNVGIVLDSPANNGWFKVSLANSEEGYLHYSVLGACTIVTELKKEPYEGAKTISVKTNTPVYLEEAPVIFSGSTAFLKLSFYRAGKREFAYANYNMLSGDANCGHGKHPKYR